MNQEVTDWISEQSPERNILSLKCLTVFADRMLAPLCLKACTRILLMKRSKYHKRLPRPYHDRHHSYYCQCWSILASGMTGLYMRLSPFGWDDPTVRRLHQASVSSRSNMFKKRFLLVHCAVFLFFLSVLSFIVPWPYEVAALYFLYIVLFTFTAIPLLLSLCNLKFHIRTWWECLEKMWALLFFYFILVNEVGFSIAYGEVLPKSIAERPLFEACLAQLCKTPPYCGRVGLSRKGGTWPFGTNRNVERLISYNWAMYKLKSFEGKSICFLGGAKKVQAPYPSRKYSLRFGTLWLSRFLGCSLGLWPEGFRTFATYCLIAWNRPQSFKRSSCVQRKWSLLAHQKLSSWRQGISASTAAFFWR